MYFGICYLNTNSEVLSKVTTNLKTLYFRGKKHIKHL